MLLCTADAADDDACGFGTCLLSVHRFEQIEVVDELKYLIKWSALSYQFCTWETREEVR